MVLAAALAAEGRNKLWYAITLIPNPQWITIARMPALRTIAFAEAETDFPALSI